MPKAEEKSITVKFLKPYICYDKGQIKDATPQFAHSLIEAGIAKRVKTPKRDKMLAGAPMEKSL